MMAILYALPLIASLPSGTPSLIEIPHREETIESSGPLSPDVTDLSHLLEAVECHMVCGDQITTLDMELSSFRKGSHSDPKWQFNRHLKILATSK